MAAVKDTRYAVPALLALSSLRISRMRRCDGSTYHHPQNSFVAGAVVLDEHNTYQVKKQNKNRASTRNVPVLIQSWPPPLSRTASRQAPCWISLRTVCRIAVHKICKENGLPDVSVHGLRHSFASLAYRLKMPERIAMEIGGWSNPATMHEIYTHIAQSDIQRYKTAMADFYGMPAKKPSKNL